MKQFFIKIAVCILVFVGVIAIHFISLYQNQEADPPPMQSATLPILNMVYEDTDINMLQGYTTYMDAKYMHDAITPLEEDRSIGITIKKYDNVIATMSYEIRTLDTERLIDKQNIDKFVSNGDYIYATIDASRIMEYDTEYMLIVKLVSEKHGDIYYYTRIEEQTESDVKEHLDFVSAMSKDSLDKTAAEAYTRYLEPSSLMDNTNLGHVTIKSSFSNFTWGNLKVTRVTEPVVTIKEIIDDLGSYELQYKVMAYNEYDVAQYYNVTEFYRVRKSGDRMYLYVYDRTMEQIFEGTNQYVSTTRVNLGIDSDLDVEYSHSAKGSYVSFVKERNLWLMDMRTNEIISIFSFESGSDNDVRDIFDENDIEIISTDGEGNVLFLVYGYMNRGDHEGKVGTGLYQYTRKEHKVTELVFAQSTKPYHILRESMGRFAYVKDDSHLYMMIGDAIYTVTFDSNEYVRLVSNLKKGNYIISDDENIIAWHENTEVYGANTIRVINIQTGDDYIISAEEGDYIKVLGFIEHDLIYGTAKQADVYTTEMGDTVFPMYKMNVVMESKEDIESYQKDNIYITDVSIIGNMIKLSRMSKNESGSFIGIDEDQFVNKNVASEDIIKLTTIATDMKKKELILNFAYTVTKDTELRAVYIKEANFMSGISFEQIDTVEEDKNYYVYGEGQLKLVTDKPWEAINAAYDYYGVAVKGNGDYLWERTTKVSRAGVNVEDMVGKGYDSFEAAVNIWQGEVLDVTKGYYDTLFYYATKEYPVLIMLDGYGMVTVDGYIGYSGSVSTVYLTDMDTGEMFSMGYQELQKYCGKSGLHYMVLFE